jgi:hypothetical protein
VSRRGAKERQRGAARACGARSGPRRRGADAARPGRPPGCGPGPGAQPAYRHAPLPAAAVAAQGGARPRAGSSPSPGPRLRADLAGRIGWSSSPPPLLP